MIRKKAIFNPEKYPDIPEIMNFLKENNLPKELKYYLNFKEDKIQISKSIRYMEIWHPELYLKINEYYNNIIKINNIIKYEYKSNKFIHKVFTFIHKIIPKCKSCNKEPRFTTGNYKKYCSNKCAMKDPEHLSHHINLQRSEIINKKRSKSLKLTYSDPLKRQVISKNNWKRWGQKSSQFSHLKNIQDLNKEFIKKNFLNTQNQFLVKKFMNHFGYKYDKQPYIWLKKFNINYNKWKSSSQAEKEIIEFIKSIYSGEIIENDRKILSGKELDIFIPEKKLAIEFNGLYWHSFNQKELIQEFKYKHLKKTEACEAKRINLLHIFENEWLNEKTKDIWKSIISYKLGLIQNKYYARKLIIKEISSKEAKVFFEENHLQGGNAPAKIALGAFTKDTNELISCMTFSKSRYSKDHEYELIRFASKKYSSCVGCAQKLFKYFINNYDPSSIVSYANRRWAYKHKNLYKSIGFRLLRIAEPNFYYFKLNELRLWPRVKFQKYKLKDLEETKEFYEPNKSAIEIVFNAGYRRIYDSGNFTFEWKI